MKNPDIAKCRDFFICYNVITIECFVSRNALHCLFLETLIPIN